MSPDARLPVCVFAKAARPGAVKTRLAPALGDEGAARLAKAFREDTLAGLRRSAGVRPILAATERETEEGVETWPQGSGDLGARLSRILRRALASSPAAVAIGSDTPGLPPRLLERAREALLTSDAVLGPCEDGGFYLIGVRKLPRGLLSGLPWSTGETFEKTLARLRERGMATVVLPPWFDVDRPEDLERLRGLLSRRVISAPATARFLELSVLKSPGSARRRRAGSRARAGRRRRSEWA